jgi:hypothetical protein
MMDNDNIKKISVALGHAFVGWALCGAIMGVGPIFLSMETTLILHAIGAPIIFAAVSWSYFIRFGYTTPLQTALIFTSFVIFMDFFLVSWIIMGNFEMFASAIGTWIPFALLFTATYLTGLYVNSQEQVISPSH